MEETTLLIAKGGYLSARYFNNLDFETRYKIQTEYPEPLWIWPRVRLSDKNKITKSAIEIATKVKNHLNIEVFPLIVSIAIKGYASDGQYKFCMYGKDQYETYYFDCPAKWYSKKSSQLAIYNDGSDNIISIKQH